MRKLLLAMAIIVLIGWFFYCTKTHGPKIEEDLVSRVTEMLQDSSQEYLGINVDADLRHITLRGELSSQSEIDEIGSRVKNIYGVKTVNNLLTAKPKPEIHIDYQTGVQIDSQRIVLSGMVPSAEEKELMLATAKENYMDFDIIDRLVIQDGAPSHWNSSLHSLIIEMKQFIRGNAVLLNNTIAVSGDVDSQEKSDEAVASLRETLGGSIQFNPRINVLAVEVKESEEELNEIRQQAINCQKEFSRVLNSGKIEFKTNSEEIQMASFALLNSLVDIANKCPDSSVEVSGHTDSQGSESYNKQLSERRAESVSQYLISKGVAESRLSSVGYGELQPIESNDTASGRAANRRIELKVMEN